MPLNENAFLLDSVGEGEGGMFQENSIETCILSRVKQITSPGWMHETSARTWCTGNTMKTFKLLNAFLEHLAREIKRFRVSREMVILSRTGVAVRERWQLEYGVAMEGKECLNQLLEMEELEKCLSLSRRTAEVSKEK